eukprot:3300479-Pleurochrysis_carterae.AAC.4
MSTRSQVLHVAAPCRLHRRAPHRSSRLGARGRVRAGRGPSSEAPHSRRRNGWRLRSGVYEAGVLKLADSHGSAWER